jgi:hypothetical protein
MQAEPAIILHDNGKENPWHRAGRLWGKLSPANRILVCVAGGLVLLILFAVSWPKRFVPISYEEFAAKQAKTDESSIYEIHPGLNGYKPWSQLTAAQKRKCWEWEVAYERSRNTPEARAERKRAAEAGAAEFMRQMNEARDIMEGRKAPAPYPYPIGSDPKELNGRDFAAP